MGLYHRPALMTSWPARCSFLSSLLPRSLSSDRHFIVGCLGLPAIAYSSDIVHSGISMIHIKAKELY